MAEHKRDYIDRQAKAFHQELNLPVSIASAIALPVAARMLGIPTEGLGGLITIPLGHSMLRTVWEWGNQWYFDAKWEDLGRRTLKFSFNGEAIKRPGMELKKGDEFLYYKIGDITTNDGKKPQSKEQEAAIVDFYDLLLKTMGPTINNWGGDYAALELGDQLPDNVTNFFKSRTTVTKGELLAGKDVVVSEPDKKVVLLTKKEADGMKLRPRDIFQKEMEVLQDKVVEEYLAMLPQLASPSERANLQFMFEQRLEQILRRQTLAHLVSPQITKTRDHNGILQRRRAEMNGFLQKIGGEWCVNLVSDRGEMQQVRVDKILGRDKKSVEAKFKKNGLEQAEAAFHILKLLETTTLEELAKNQELSWEEVKNNLVAQGLTTNPQQTENSNFLSRLSERYKRGDGFIDLNATFFSHALNLRRRMAIPFITAAIVIAALPLSIAMKDSSIVGRFIGDTLRGGKSSVGIPNITSQNLQIEEKSKPAFFEGNLTQDLEWKIDHIGEVFSYGYYTVSTSNKFNSDGEWEFNQTRAYEFKNKEGIPQKGIYLQRPIGLNSSVPTRFKIPLRNNSRLHSVILSSDKINYKTYVLTDGTVEVEIDKSEEAFTLLTAILEAGSLGEVEDSQIIASQVKAVGDVSPIDRNKLGKNALAIVRSAERYQESTGDPQAFEWALGEMVRLNHKYSLVSPDGFPSPDKSAENFINTILDGGRCTCDVCNPEFVLMSSLGGLPVNLAHGYLYGMMNREALGGGYLIGGTRHSYAVGSNGEIYDATPSELSDDTKTQLFDQQLKSLIGASNREEADKRWGRTVIDTSNYYTRIRNVEKFDQGIKYLAILAALPLGLLGLLTLKDLLLEAKKPSNLRKVGDKLVAKLYTPEELSRSYDFYGWLSWGGDRQKGNHQVSGLTTQELIEELRGNINFESLDKDKRLKDRGFKLKLLASYLGRMGK